MKVFVDANVLLDVLFIREPHYAESAQVWALAEAGTVDAYVSAASLPIVFYMLRRANRSAAAHEGVRLVREIFKLVPLDSAAIDHALDSGMRDFEDAIQLACALRAGAAALITRDTKGFAGSTLAVQTPTQFLATHFPNREP